MKIVYTARAAADLDEILAYVELHYPSVYANFESHVHTITHRLGNWPESARRVTEQSNIRVIPLVVFPYKIFYQITPDTVEILYIHHSSRES